MDQYGQLDPVRLLSDIRKAQQHLVDIADMTVTAIEVEPDVSLDQFLSGLQVAWQDGEIRPTTKPKPKAKRLRRRPDPFVAVADRLRGWFEAEPWRTAHEILDRLQGEQPSVFPDRLLRTLQRRLKDWRRDAARRLVFGEKPLHQMSHGDIAEEANNGAR
ncbi:hypothetical protein SIL87_19935 [Acidiphilium acidophilum]|uniref:Transposase n=1 Tax=Acidiphilium acidophilum TaxID=76588 RepID=A0AAW9DVB2_ACIAO|nr:hypothetical protein [Acidiphilium acidophilum]